MAGVAHAWAIVGGPALFLATLILMAVSLWERLSLGGMDA